MFKRNLEGSKIVSRGQYSISDNDDEIKPVSCLLVCKIYISQPVKAAGKLNEYDCHFRHTYI